MYLLLCRDFLSAKKENGDDKKAVLMCCLKHNVKFRALLILCFKLKCSFFFFSFWWHPYRTHHWYKYTNWDTPSKSFTLISGYYEKNQKFQNKSFMWCMYGVLRNSLSVPINLWIIFFIGNHFSVIFQIIGTCRKQVSSGYFNVICKERKK